MSDTSAIGERARRHLRGHVSLRKVVELPRGRIEVWGRRYTARTASYFVADDGAAFRTDASWSAFSRMLKAGGVDLADTDLLAGLVREGPGVHLVARVASDVPEAHRADRWAPELRDGAWTAHCRDAVEGRWQRITIGADRSVTLETLGAAPKAQFR